MDARRFLIKELKPSPVHVQTWESFRYIGTWGMSLVHARNNTIDYLKWHLCCQLSLISFIACSRVTDVGVQHLVKNCKHVINLNLSGCKVYNHLGVSVSSQRISFAYFALFLFFYILYLFIFRNLDLFIWIKSEI